MTEALTPDVLRRDARKWLEANAPAKGGPDDFSGIHLLGADSIEEFLEQEQHVYEVVRSWQRRLVDAGWAGLSWPRAYGGQELPSWADEVFADEQSHFGVSTKALATGLQMVPPAMLRFGSPEQCARFLPPALRADEIWCQLFSEPGAGSDLTSVSTYAEQRTDGGWRLNGQKVWTSGAAVSDWAVALTRTDRGTPGREGLTCFVVNMHDPGIEVRPLREMAGGYHFNEVFLEDVDVAADDMLGEVGGGWAFARTVLTSERASIGGGTSGRTAGLLRTTAASVEATSDPRVRQAVAAAYIRERVLDLHLLRARSGSASSSIVKLLYSEHARLTASDGVAVLGARGMTTESHETASTWIDRLLFAPGLRIGGGTDEIQRNAIAERELGLPRDPKPVANPVGTGQ